MIKLKSLLHEQGDTAGSENMSIWERALERGRRRYSQINGGLELKYTSQNKQEFYLNPNDQGRFLSGRGLTMQLLSLSDAIPSAKSPKDYANLGTYVRDLFAKNSTVSEDDLKKYFMAGFNRTPQWDNTMWIVEQLKNNRKSLHGILIGISGDKTKAEAAATKIIQQPGFNEKWMQIVRTLPPLTIQFADGNELNIALKNLDQIIEHGFYQTSVTSDLVPPNTKTQELAPGSVYTK